MAAISATSSRSTSSSGDPVEQGRGGIRLTAQKSHSSWLAAIGDLVRFKNPHFPETLSQRTVVRAGLQRSEELAKIDEEEETLLFQPQLSAHLKRIQKRHLNPDQISFLEAFKFTSAKGNAFDLKKWIAKFNNRSSSNEENLFDYLTDEFTKEREAANQTFFKAIGISSGDVTIGVCLLTKKYLGHRAYLLKPVQELSIVNGLFRMEYANMAHLALSHWTPNQSFEALAEELQNCGPLCVTGRFGKNYYKGPPTIEFRVRDQRGARTIYGWSSANRVEEDPKNREKEDLDLPAILLVGAETMQNGKKFVFYKETDEERICAMSYQRLIDPKTIATHNGINPSEINPALCYALRAATPEEISQTDADDRKE